MNTDELIAELASLLGEAKWRMQGQSGSDEFDQRTNAVLKQVRARKESGAAQEKQAQ